MNRADRRRHQKQLSNLSKKVGTDCELCGQPLMHLNISFAGLTSDKHLVLAGECCSHKLVTILKTGVYSCVDGAANRLKEIGSLSLSNDPAFALRLNSDIRRLDMVTSQVMKNGGVSVPPKAITLTETPWKHEDADWFKRRPERSHRMRLLQDGEMESLPSEMKRSTAPLQHRWEVIVRQVQEGQRIRTLVLRDMSVYIKDDEQLLHALFDIAFRSGPDKVIEMAEVHALAHRYRTAPDAYRN